MSSSTSKLWQIVPEKLSPISALTYDVIDLAITTATTTSFCVEHVYLQYEYGATHINYYIQKSTYMLSQMDSLFITCSY